MPLRSRHAPSPLESAHPIELRLHGDFVEWLAVAGGTLAVTTYNSGKLALFSAPAGRLTASYWRFPRPMGLAVENGRLAMVSRDHVWTFRMAPEFTVESVRYTGRLDAHDLAFDRRGLLFATTRFNCVARPSDRVNFQRHWQPPFISQMHNGDCCHLNGVGVKEGRLAIATAFCESAAPAAWRQLDRFASGVLIDVHRNHVAARGLCMPHSPRWHEGRWWLCNSGEGSLCTFDTQRGHCEPVIYLPGFTRGLCFAANRAVVGLSRIRRRHILDAPPVRRRFKHLRPSVALVDPTSGVETGVLEFITGGREVYDAAFLSQSG
jgi:uncharacterized protein (TIGR03032 family)